MNLTIKIIIAIILLSIEAIIICSAIKRSNSKEEAIILVLVNLICFSFGFILSKIPLPL